MAEYKLISADSHIVEPPDMYTGRIEPKFRDRAPKMERRKTPSRQGIQRLGARRYAGRDPRRGHAGRAALRGPLADRFPRRLGGCPQGRLRCPCDDRENEEDGVWGSCLQPSQGLFWYRIPDSELLTEICRVYNDWIADFCKPYPERLKGIGMLNVDDVNVGLQELKRCKKLGLVGAFIPVSPLPDKPYSHPIYDRLWGTAQDLAMPLLLHIATPRHGVPGNEFTMNVAEMTGAGRSTTDYWVRYSLSSMVFAGVFDRYPRLKAGSVSTRPPGSRTGYSRWTSPTASGRYSPRAGSRARECCRAITGSAICSSSLWKTSSGCKCATRSASRRCCGAAISRTPIDLAQISGFLGTHLCRRSRGGPARDHFGQCGEDVRVQAELAARPLTSSSLALSQREEAPGELPDAR